MDDDQEHHRRGLAYRSGYGHARDAIDRLPIGLMSDEDHILSMRPELVARIPTGYPYPADWMAGIDDGLAKRRPRY